MDDAKRTEERAKFLEQTVSRLLRERTELMGLVNRLRNQREALNSRTDTISSDNTDRDSAFLNQAGELLRPIIHDMSHWRVGIEAALRRIESRYATLLPELHKDLSSYATTIDFLFTQLDRFRQLSRRAPDISFRISVNDIVRNRIKVMKSRYPLLTIESAERAKRRNDGTTGSRKRRAQQSGQHSDEGDSLTR